MKIHHHTATFAPTSRIIVVAAAAVLWLAPALNHAFPYYADQIPNGHSVPNGSGGIWVSVGHVKERGGGPRNPFGNDFGAHDHVWTDELCRTDSDGDGRTNGAELGDPDCVWVMGADPTEPARSHPGIVDADANVDDVGEVPLIAAVPENKKPQVAVDAGGGVCGTDDDCPNRLVCWDGFCSEASTTTKSAEDPSSRNPSDVRDAPQQEEEQTEEQKEEEKEETEDGALVDTSERIGNKGHDGFGWPAALLVGGTILVPSLVLVLWATRAGPLSSLPKYHYRPVAR
jgi:hypothetical protein